MFDGVQYICLFDVTSNAWKLLSVETNDDGDYSEISDSRVQPVTHFSMQHTILSLMCRRFSARFFLFLRAARHPADSDARPTAGARVLAMVLMVPWHLYHSGPAPHCTVSSRSERCLLS